jgi:hypothetical protein
LQSTEKQTLITKLVKESPVIVDLDEGTLIETWAGSEMLTCLSKAITSCVAAIISILQSRYSRTNRFNA